MKFRIWKKIITVGIGAVLIASVLTVICTHLNYNTYVKENNTALLNLISMMLEAKENETGEMDAIYEITKDEIVQSLENGDYTNLEILREYGYDVDTQFFLDTNQENLRQNIFKNLIIVNTCVLMTLFIFYLYLEKRERKIHEFICYLQELQEQNYTLKIEENGEEELSRLQNELYKLTILLKEQAENSVQDKCVVKDNIVDISHQLKTPLASISIMLDNIMEYPEMDSLTKETFLVNIRERISHMELLVQSLLKLSRFDANVVVFQNEKTGMKKLIKNAVEKNQILIEQKSIEISVEGSDEVTLICDHTWQTEAISNIIKNAIEHSYQDGRIEITMIENNFAVVIKIRDYGSGIKKENRQKIFTRYYKDEESSEQSLGIGLNLAKTIIEKNQGSIVVHSKENEGSVFEIRYMK